MTPLTKPLAFWAGVANQVLSSELHFARVNATAESLDSYVPLSAMRGGVTRFRRQDLVEALQKEDTLMKKYQDLHAMDK